MNPGAETALNSPTISKPGVTDSVRRACLRIGKLAFSIVHPRCWAGLSRGVAPSTEHRRILQALDCDLVLDVGANRGQFSMLMHVLKPVVSIHAYEPLPSEARTFLRILGHDRNIVLHEIALGDEPGERVLHVSRQPDSSSLLPIGNLQSKIFPGTEEVSTRLVTVATLDSFPSHWKHATRALLKIDVQGSELSVLRGAREAIRHSKWIYVECSEVTLYRGQALLPEVAAFLAGEGFTLRRRSNETWRGGRLIQADCLFERKTPALALGASQMCDAAAERPLRILVHGINFAPELTGIGKYTGELVAWLASRGHAVRVVTAPPYYPHWRIQPGFRASGYRHEERDGASVWRCPLWVPAELTGRKRLLHLASFVASSKPVMLRQAAWRPDVVMAVAPALLAAPVSWLTARLSGAGAWLHLQDFEVDAAFNLGLLKSSRTRRAAMAVERWLLRRFDLVSTISPRMVERLGAKGVHPERQALLPNWVDVTDIRPVAASPYRAELDLAPDAVVALYSGNMGEKQGLELLLHAARALAPQPHIVFVLCGDGAARARLERAAEGLTNIRWLPLQPAERLNDLLNLADIHLLPQRADAADLVMPSKLTGMLASGRPVVTSAAAGTQVAQVVTGAGIVVPPGDADGFAAAIMDLAKDRERRARLGRNAREFAVRHLDRDAVLGRLELELLALTRTRRRGAAAVTAT